MKPEQSEAFAGRVLAALPSLRPRYETTAAQCRAEGLPAAAPAEFLHGYSYELSQAWHDDPASAREPLAALAAVLEAEYGADRGLDSLIESNFLVRLPGGRDPDPVALLGPKLAAWVRAERGWRAAPADAAFVQRVVAAVPALAPLAADNTYGDQEDVLIHPFLGEVTFREAELAEAGRLDEPRAVADLMEQALGSDVDEPIAVSFVENLPWPGEPGAALLDLLGPKLRAVLAEQRGQAAG